MWKKYQIVHYRIQWRTKPKNFVPAEQWGPWWSGLCDDLVCAGHDANPGQEQWGVPEYCWWSQYYGWNNRHRHFQRWGDGRHCGCLAAALRYMGQSSQHGLADGIHGAARTHPCNGRDVRNSATVRHYLFISRHDFLLRGAAKYQPIWWVSMRTLTSFHRRQRDFPVTRSAVRLYRCSQPILMRRIITV